MNTIDLKQVEKEIVDIHQFFEAYFNGTIEHAKVSMFEKAMGDGFTIIASDGRITDRDSIIKVIKSAYNQRDNIRIWIENVVIRHQVNDTVIVTYEEWQTIDSATTTRMSTVVFRIDETAPNNLTWLIVHESGLKTVKT